MAFIKRASTEIIPSDFVSSETLSADPDITNRFKKFAEHLKSIAPRANDFLYFSAIMMHAAEASSIDGEGNIKLGSDGEPVKCGWESQGDSIKWWCTDNSIKPYKNSNNDIFPEKELIAAYKKWVGKPLCLDHKSSSVDAIRGVVIDTHYDPKFKRVVALCALDKVNYEDLARKVSTGYATSVSMGTAVGKAICSDCGAVAKIESDFCDHMRRKSCYGEINVDLSPIELSIVVNGADPNAKIRTIVASAKQALDKYASIKDKISTGEVDAKELGEIRVALKELTERLEGLETVAEQTKQDVEDSAYGVTNSSQHMAESEEPSQLPNIQTPGEARLSVGSLEETINNIHAKLGEIKTDLGTLSLPKESKMAETKKEAYFQGAGGVNEPTPGQPKYEKENYQSVRDNEDKQMNGQTPFPDTGPVDGMHPGPASVGMSELERKKMLARAKADERAKLRKEALAKVSEKLEKEGYYQGGGDANDPEKLPYPKEDYKKTRDKEDKQMVGQAPFPGVGSIDGLHPSPASADQKDELARKKMLQRASLKAKFIKAMATDGTDDQSKSRWDVYADNKLILTATVNDISGGRVDALYDTIATKQFGTSLLSKIKSEGVEKVASAFGAFTKSAQMPAPMDAAPGGAPEAPGGAAPMEMPEEPMGEEAGSPADTAMNIAEEIRDRASDLVEMLRASEGEAAEMEGVEELAPEAAEAAPTTASLNVMRKKLNGALVQGAKQALAELKDHHEEMRLVAHIFSDPSKITEDNKGFVASLKEDSFTDAKTTLAETKKLMSAFVKYAQGSEALEKRASAEAELVKQAQYTEKDFEVDTITPAADDAEIVADLGMGDDAGVGCADESEYGDTDMAIDLESVVEQVVSKELGGNMAADDGAADSAAADDGSEADSTADSAESDSAAADDSDSDDAEGLTTKEARAMQRAKVAQKGLKFMDLLNQAHPGGGVTTDMDVKPTGDLAKVETLEEAHRKHMDVASAPPKVRKQAEEIQRLVTAGELAKEDVDQLVSMGVDKEAVSYWHKLYDAAPDGGKEFASELTKEKYAAAAEEDKQQYRVKLTRAYELATDMQARGMVDNTKSAFNQTVSEIMSWGDKAFDSIKRVVAQQELKKEASVKVPEVGWLGSGEAKPAQSGEEQSASLQAQLEAAMSGRKY